MDRSAIIATEEIAIRCKIANGCQASAWFLMLVVFLVGKTEGEEPPTIQPFEKSAPAREDAVRGVVVLSDGSKHAGLVYLTRDKGLQIYDETVQRQREIPLSAVQKIQCEIQQERLEREWRFKEGANNEKLFTGRMYPMREYLYTITLRDGRKITGPLSAIVYVASNLQPDHADQPPLEPKRFLLNKRDKGKPGESLKALVYVDKIVLEKEELGIED